MIKIREIQTISEEEVPWLAPSYIHSDCRCLGAFEDACAGIILYEIKERILYIRYVYVREELRGQGIGGMLFQELQELVQREAPEGMIVSGVIPREQQSAMVRFFMQRKRLHRTFDISPEKIRRKKILHWRWHCELTSRRP